jgi:16S rRNA (guanine527-N7)-methyltransferase
VNRATRETPLSSAAPPICTAATAAELADCCVSRETLARLEVFAALLMAWQQSINLVAPASLPDLWRRHILDSAQLWPLLPEGAQRLIDLGSGAGFPGLILAILGVPEVHLVESDRRKAAFLREAARVTGATVTVHVARAETLALPPAGIVTARALAALDRLLPLVRRFLAPGGVALLPKGREAQEELTLAGTRWKMRAELIASRTDPMGRILRLQDLDPIA